MWSEWEILNKSGLSLNIGRLSDVDLFRVHKLMKAYVQRCGRNTSLQTIALLDRWKTGLELWDIGGFGWSQIIANLIAAATRWIFLLVESQCHIIFSMKEGFEQWYIRDLDCSEIMVILILLVLVKSQCLLFMLCRDSCWSQI